MQKKCRILLVEDDISFGKILKDYLSLNGFDVTHLKDGIDGWNAFRNHHFDLCILDIMMPKRDGIELAGMIRNESKNIPLFFLTAKGQKHDVINGYEAGADDFIVKPVDADILLHKIKATLKRTAMEAPVAVTEESTINIGTFTFNHIKRSLIVNNNATLLSPKEADLLHLLCTHKNQLVTREEILRKLWKEVNYFTGRSLDVYIVKLRKYLQQDKSISLNNLHKSGYILEVTEAVRV
jgi:two-component system OmpR family response regulator